jgi:hypothetical protein
VGRQVIEHSSNTQSWLPLHSGVMRTYTGFGIGLDPESASHPGFVG